MTLADEGEKARYIGALREERISAVFLRSLAAGFIPNRRKYDDPRFRNLGLEAASGLQAIQPRQIEIDPQNKVGFRNRESVTASSPSTASATTFRSEPVSKNNPPDVA